MSSLLAALVLASTAAPDRVVVYPDRAQVTRLATVPCGTRTPVTFTHIPPAAAGDSFRARLTDGTIDGLRAHLEARQEEFSPRVEALRKQLEGVIEERRALEDQNGRAREQVELARGYEAIAVRLVNREMVLEKPDVKAWQAAFDGSLAAELASAKSAADTQAKLREVGRREQALNRELVELQELSSRETWTVEVLASCPEGKSGELVLTYLVGGAAWTPAYEARADEGQGQIELATWATVTQRTGETWKGVELTLSTAVPSQNATPPELKKLMVTTWEKPPEKKVLVRRDEYVDHAQASGSEQSEAPGPVAAKNQGLSVQLQVPERAEVPGDGAPVRLLVGKTRLRAAFEVRALPKLYPFAFRVAEVTNQAPWPLLPGRLDAFRATGLVGRYGLERVPQGGAFTLTFGVEDSVRVKRTVLEELKRDTGLFNSNRRFTYAYKFELANYGKAPLDVALTDHLPVSELADIAVSVGEKTTPGYQQGAQDGLVKWKVSLKAQEKKTVDFIFRVDVPTSYETGGL